MAEGQHDGHVTSRAKAVRLSDASMAMRQAQDRERIRRLDVRERMLLALELGRRGREFQRRVKRGRIDDIRP